MRGSLYVYQSGVSKDSGLLAVISCSLSVFSYTHTVAMKKGWAYSDHGLVFTTAPMGAFSKE
jgi:hypothetical protein